MSRTLQRINTWQIRLNWLAARLGGPKACCRIGRARLLMSRTPKKSARQVPRPPDSFNSATVSTSHLSNSRTRLSHRRSRTSALARRRQQLFCSRNFQPVRSQSGRRAALPFAAISISALPHCSLLAQPELAAGPSRRTKRRSSHARHP